MSSFVPSASSFVPSAENPWTTDVSRVWSMAAIGLKAECVRSSPAVVGEVRKGSRGGGDGGIGLFGARDGKVQARLPASGDSTWNMTSAGRFM